MVISKTNNLFSAEVKKARRNLFNTHTGKKPSTSEGTDKQRATPRKKRRHASSRKCEGQFVGSLFLSSAEGTRWEGKSSGESKYMGKTQCGWLFFVLTGHVDTISDGTTSSPYDSRKKWGKHRLSFKKKSSIKKQSVLSLVLIMSQEVFKFLSGLGRDCGFIQVVPVSQVLGKKLFLYLSVLPSSTLKQCEFLANWATVLWFWRADRHKSQVSACCLF